MIDLDQQRASIRALAKCWAHHSAHWEREQHARDVDEVTLADQAEASLLKGMAAGGLDLRTKIEGIVT